MQTKKTKKKTHQAQMNVVLASIFVEFREYVSFQNSLPKVLTYL